MGTLGNNTSGKIERNVIAYFCGGDEMNLLKDLLKDPEEVKKIEKLSNDSAENLYRRAKRKINDAKEGRVNPEDMEDVQREIVRLLAAIDGLHLVKMLEKLPDEDAYTNEAEDEDVCGMQM